MINPNKFKNGVRGIQISSLFEKDKIYSLDRNSENYYKEDKNGTLRPESNHCWLTWESKEKEEDGNIYWISQAQNYSTLEEAEKGKKVLEKYLNN
jgi:hypothetical protein